uniref:Cysteine--tRNA ligase n=2 Tax=Desulfobacterium TaxID=2295 RepID=E1YIT1_9BACT|nr:Cysteinyl-tRNA synthetase [uncultured Desulfobacterium sp.]
MSLRIYNTIERKKVPFEPVQPGKVSMYVCGPTVYDSCHIGHARSVIVFDVILKYLNATGLEVTYVRNFTDVDDKIINRAVQLGIESHEVAERYIKEFYEDMDALNIKRATIEPKATEHIDKIIALIEILLKKEIAYRIDGDIYYSVDKFKDYGKLSGRKLEDMEAGARVEIDERKNNPFDFALWKSQKPGEPYWESPWGRGRPGWHIECSAMSSAYLGETFDIHGGGKDLIFPHHENEIAQSEGAFEKPFAKYWVHNGFVNINHEKMSKSLGNFLLIKDILKSYHPDSVRLFLLSNHYRSPIDFTDKAMEESEAALDKIYSAIQRVEEIADITGKDFINYPEGYWEKFCESMDDDFNTAKGIGYLFDSVRHINRLLDENSNSDEIKTIINSIYADIRKMGDVIGILSEPAEIYFNKKKTKFIETKDVDPSLIDALVKQRFEARKAKDWKKADRIRDKLSGIDVIIEDKPEGSIWKFKS